MCCRGERKKMNQEQQCCQASKIAAACSFQIDFQNSSTFVVFFGNQKHILGRLHTKIPTSGFRMQKFQKPEFQMPDSVNQNSASS